VAVHVEVLRQVLEFDGGIVVDLDIRVGVEVDVPHDLGYVRRLLRHMSVERALSGHALILLTHVDQFSLEKDRAEGRPVVGGGLLQLLTSVLFLLHNFEELILHQVVDLCSVLELESVFLHEI